MTFVTDDLLRLAPVIPVVVVDDPDDAVPLVRTLAAGGLPAVEITLRTTTAVDAIRLAAAEVPEAVVGAGTVVTPPQVDDVLDAGGRFLVTPGTTPTLLDALLESERPFLPGAATASEVVALLERGVTAAKLFPAAPLGGPALLRAFAGPFPQMRFCPTGGIGQETAREYLRLANVACVGGSWMVPAGAVAARDWGRIEELARAAAQLWPAVEA
jgi:2-dehydro-3-deoxyphosphogluconate aldolase / (4S)-4-hydroxy-2-oxoglutarate aldolase